MEGTYEYECMRAELLGLEKPNESTFVAKEQSRDQNLDVEAAVLEETEVQSDDLKHVSGGFEELNSILAITQRKLNRFKNACGSLTNLLKIKINHSSPDSTSTESSSAANSETNSSSASIEPASVSNGRGKSDLANALDKQVDKLDSLIVQAENAQYSMAHQTKQMKTFLK